MVASNQERGRASQRPAQIPARGWRDIVARVARQQGEDNLSIVAAGVAFYAMLAIFPALAAVVSVYALVADPAQLQQQLQAVSQLLPGQARALISNVLGRLVSRSGGALGLSLVLGILIALWSSTKGTASLLTALDIAYKEREDRGFIRFNAVALGLTAVAIVAAVIAIALVVALPIALNALGLGGFAATALSLGRWVVLAGFVIIGLGVLYRYGPSRRPAQWRWVTPGSIVATVLWLIGSVLFSLYVSNFASYSATYGTLGAVIILLLWFNLSAYVILLGAEINSEAERQTRFDSTHGAAMPLGERHARAADTVANEYEAGREGC